MIRTTSRFPTTPADCSIEVLVGQQQVYVSRGGAVEIGLMDVDGRSGLVYPCRQLSHIPIPAGTFESMIFRTSRNRWEMFSRSLQGYTLYLTLYWGICTSTKTSLSGWFPWGST